MKFGGTSLQNASRVKQAARIVENTRKGNRIAIVVSALGHTTDWLVELGEAAEKQDTRKLKALIRRLRSLHSTTARAAAGNGSKDLAVVLDGLWLELQRAAEGIFNLRELTVKSKDYLLSFGERLSAPIVTAALQSQGVRARSFTGAEAGITTDNNFGEARPLLEMSFHQIRQRIEPVWARGNVPVVTGFLAAATDGSITTLGRGGSDYTASLIGAALSADEIWIWTDVDGLMTADPRIVKNAQVLPHVSFREALELSYFGAKMMHPRALQPAAAKKIPVRIKNSSRPSGEGTLVSLAEKGSDERVVKAISMIQGVAIVTVAGAGMIGAPGVAAKVFQALGTNNVNVVMISQGSSEATISCVVARKDIDKAVRALQLSLLGQGQVERVSTEIDVCVIAVVGAGMKGTPGVARIFGAVGRKNVNVRMVAQGSSEYNVSFVVAEKEGPQVVRAVHEEFQLESST